MASNLDRFKDNKEHITDFQSEIWVICSKCGTQGVIHRKYPLFEHEPEFTCGGCALRLRGTSGPEYRWMGTGYGLASCKCGQCRRELTKKIGLENIAKGYAYKIDITCEDCDRSTSAKVTWELTRSEPHDPTYGMELALHRRCKGESLWAYNPDHLKFIEEYVQATIRERMPNKNNSVASRLPNWIKDAKNRDSILKTIEKIKKNILSD